MSSKARFNQLSPEQKQAIAGVAANLKSYPLPTNGPRTDGQPSARHNANHQKLVVVLATIRTKGTDVGLRVAQISGLAAHTEVLKSLKLYANRPGADGCYHFRSRGEIERAACEILGKPRPR